MAIIKAGILSKVSGKVAGVVGATWKTKNYLRELVKPANPNTALQQAQRSKMAFMVRTARGINADALKPFLSKFLKTMSPYNWFIKENIKGVSGSPLAFQNAPVVAFGTLGNGGGAAADYEDNTDIRYKALPTVPSGHTLSSIALAVSTDGEFTKVDVQNNITGATGLNEQFVLASELGGKTAFIVGFLAEYDANGVLVAVCASQSFGTYSA